jgi:hypothetical protein
MADTLADAIAAAGIRKELSSYCRVDHICKHPELLKKWYDIGLRYLVVGVEAVSSERLKRFNKKTSHEQNKQAIKALRDIGIFAIPHILISPEMTAEDFDDIYAFVEEKRVRVSGGDPADAAARYTRPPAVPRAGPHHDGQVGFLHVHVQRDSAGAPRPARVRPPLRSPHFPDVVVEPVLAREVRETSFVAFLKWWLFLRVLILKLRWRRREIYRDAATRTATPCHVPSSAA